jgi:hypothetical protein
MVVISRYVSNIQRCGEGINDGGYVYRPSFPMQFQGARGAYMRATVAPTNLNCDTALFYPSFSRDRTPLPRS